MENIDTPSINGSDIKSDWGDRAWELLKQIRKPYNRVSLKRTTLLIIALYRLRGAPITHVFKREDAASFTSHYKWMHVEKGDPAYRAAYAHLIDLATDSYEKQRDELVKDALIQVERARTNIQAMSSLATRVLKDGMDATTEEGHPLYAERRQAANSVLDRVPALAKNQNQDITTGGEQLPATEAVNIVVKSLQDIKSMGQLKDEND